MKRILSLTLIIALTLSLFCLVTANAQENNGLTYIKAKDNNVIIAGYNGTEEVLTIPDTIDSCPVTEIMYNAFADNTTLKKVYLPDTVTTIDYNAFRNCFNLEYVELPNGLIRINEGAFENCRKLNINALPESLEYIGGFSFHDCEAVTSLHIPEGVTYIGSYAFSWCTNLSEISLPSTLEHIGDDVLWKTVYASNPDNWEGDCLYYNTYLLDTNAEFLGEIHIKEGTEILSDSAFQNSDVRTITMPDTVTKLSPDCFSYCINLRNISLSPNIKEIPPYAFNDCRDLTAFEIPHGVTAIGEKAFWNCVSLSYIEIPSSVVEIPPLSIGYTEYDNSMDINPENQIKCDKLTIAGYKGSAAEAYANENGFDFKALDAKYKEHALPLLELSEEQIGTNQKTLAYHEEYEYYSDANTTTTPDFVLIGIYERSEMNNNIADFYGNYVIRSHADYFPEAIKYYIYTPASDTVISLRQAYSSSPEEISNIFTQGSIGELLGDVNYDRELNIKDATLIQKELAKIQFIENNHIGHSSFVDTVGLPNYIGDFNCDGKMDIRDVTTIQKYLAGIYK
ncbi:MAG: leucine-rich repeat protein [Clostridia bacterium]|nr:leucine-rich repeat protein [Clostridia bacterium]